jgi:hypothetical protein
VHGDEAASLIEDFLSKTNGFLGGVHFFDVAGASARAPGEFANISSAAIG